MRAVCTLPAIVLVAGFWPAARAQSPEPGTVTGHVALTGRIRGTALPSNAYQPRSVARRGHHNAPEIRNVVVYLKDAAFSGPLPASRAQIRQVDEAFEPRVLAVTQGSVIDFPNGDPIFHNVFSLSAAATFDLGRFPKGASRSRVFTRPGLVKVYCHLHSHMSATILVLDHPYFTTPELDGGYTIPNVPPGRYTLVAWHERVGERASAVEIAAGRTTSIDLSLPVEGDR